MRSVTPPKLAAWLLHHHVRGYRAESLAGDLTEEYAGGRGDAWYWGQVLRAVTTSYHRALRLHGLRLLLALAAGWCAIFAAIALLGWGWAFVRHGLSAWTGFLPAQQALPADAFHDVVWILLAAGIDVGVGRLVVRIYRTHPRLVAGAFALSILAYRVPFICGLVIGVVDDPNHLPLLAEEVFATLLWMTCAWLGGLWQRQIDIHSMKR
ncbi:MAG: hypothetical protein KGO22_04730 [Gammaproteobacteria bacterium]|nr:hypothetical protein [Gammaproteobacteria bacterium]